ncbi:MAG: WG repeat-containing protein, partial [Bacteroidota bacterium]
MKALKIRIRPARDVMAALWLWFSFVFLLFFSSSLSAQPPLDSLALIDYNSVDKTHRMIRLDGQPAFDSTYSAMGDFVENRAFITQKSNYRKWGYIDGKGKVVIPCQFETAYSFNQGMARVKVMGGKWGIIDPDRNWIIEPRFDEISKVREGKALGRINNAVFLLFRDGSSKRVSSSSSRGFLGHFRCYSDGRYPFGAAQGKSYLDENGKLAFARYFEHVTPFHFGLAIVYDKGVASVIDRNGNDVIPNLIPGLTEGEALDENALVCRYRETPAGSYQFSFICDRSGTTSFSCSDSTLFATANGHVKVYDKKADYPRLSIMHRDGSPLIPERFASISDFVPG